MNMQKSKIKHHSELNKVAVIGFGVTGQSVIRYLGESTNELIAMDTRELLTNAKSLKKAFPKVRLVTGGLDAYTLQTADMVVVSPGVSIQEHELARKIGENTQLVGDIELFVREAKAPIIAITGSNGKSTVATMVARMLEAAGKVTLLGGNIGTPALDLLVQDVPDFYVLELSSFQLETTQSLAAEVAVVLNLSEDHLDRYPNFSTYANTKLGIYRHAKLEVINRDEPLVPQIMLDSSISFGKSTPNSSREFGLSKKNGTTYLVQGKKQWLSVDDMRLKGQASWLNALASLALLHQAGVEIIDKVINAISTFEGLQDRCELVADKNNIHWINDSKGTNVGASLAAIKSFTAPKILIMGGQSKGANFQPLVKGMDGSVRIVILLGEDADQLEQALQEVVSIKHVQDLEQAILFAKDMAKSGDVVLFSPACASFDMFENYAVRGEVFRRLVQENILGEVVT